MSKLNQVSKWAAIVVLALVTVLFLLLMDRYGAARRSVDNHQGTLTAAGLSGPAEIRRDENGVPHIFGQSEDDVSFALGVAHAQDRLWQMELFRRAGQGRLAELFGKTALPADRYLRTLGLYQLAEKSLPHLSAETRAMLDAYAKGVNAYLTTRDIPLPPEFLFLAHEPEPWAPADSVVMIKLLALGLSGNATRELSRARLSEILSAIQIDEFEPPYPGDAPVALRDLAALFSKSPIKEAAASIPDIGPKGASNNWVVDGSWTASGKPLLANDPHLGMLAPSIWYLAHLAYPDRNVVGGTIAGVPSIVLGRNDHIAWGYTNTGPDTQDLYIEKLNPDNAHEYLTPEGYRPFETRTEIIRVRFGSDENLTVQTTRHGPVLPSDTFGAGETTPEGHVIALAWTTLTEFDKTIEAGHQITKAKSFAEFREALTNYIAPMQNMVFASVTGEIGFIAPARVPIRAPGHETQGLLPAPGWTTQNDWQGFIPFSALPQARNPERGFIVTANNKIVPDTYPYSITRQWDLPDRAIRIEELLTASRAHTVASFEAMLMDNSSQMAKTILPLLLTVMEENGPADGLLERLTAWDGAMDADRAEPLIFMAWMRELARHIYVDELQDQFQPHWRLNPTFLKAVLTDENDQAHWCNDQRTDDMESCAYQVRAAWVDALKDLQDRYGENQADWNWADAHPVVNRHLPGSALPLISDWLTIKHPSSGGNDTINRGQHVISSEQPFDNIHAAGYRAVYDFADLNASRYMISTGQSGNPFSADYDVFTSAWTAGESITIQTERNAISTRSIFMLQPAS